MSSSIKRIAIVTRPAERAVGPDASSFTPARAFYHYDELATAMARYTRLEVTVVEDALGSVGDDSFVLLDTGIDERDLVGCDPMLPSRVILMNGDRPPTLLETMEKWGLAGGFEYNRYRRWLDKRDADSGDGLFGRREIATRMGAEFHGDGLFASPHFGYVSLPGCKGLPELLVRYIEAFGGSER